MPDLAQVPQLDPGVVALGLEPVVTILGGDRVKRDDQAGPVCPGSQPPGAVSAGRPVRAGGREGESEAKGHDPGGAAGPARRIATVRRPGFAAFRPLFAVTLGFGPGAAVPDG